MLHLLRSAGAGPAGWRRHRCRHGAGPTGGAGASAAGRHRATDTEA